MFCYPCAMFHLFKRRSTMPTHYCSKAALLGFFDCCNDVIDFFYFRVVGVLSFQKQITALHICLLLMDASLAWHDASKSAEANKLLGFNDIMLLFLNFCQFVISSIVHSNLGHGD
ncbi:hypothetical protein RIF29_27884 [Crotalaria pallida]|uniref:Uncharacterized protein n=1 Tax=Crotalaria pallida TaxID=3830 RepID=A0AAN9EUS0_CROPI